MYGRYDEDGEIFNEAEEPDVDDREQHCDGVQGADEQMPVGEDEEQDSEAIALEQTKRYCIHYKICLPHQVMPS